jgi:AraC-like DNA-binding protein
MATRSQRTPIYMDKSRDRLHIMAVDCCQHVIERLKSVPRSQLSLVAHKKASDLKLHSQVDLITIGIPKYPVRRLFIGQLRKIYPEVPILVLRREQISRGELDEWVRGEFVLSDQSDNDADCEMVAALRKIMPFPPCEHLQKDQNYDTLRDLIVVLTRRYSDPALDLAGVARNLAVSPKRLSFILNQEAGVSFRHLLRNVRIEEAKRILRSHRYSVKEVAARVGFTDSHYFSRSFKELTGHSASQYRERTVVLN